MGPYNTENLKPVTSELSLNNQYKEVHVDLKWKLLIHSVEFGHLKHEIIFGLQQRKHHFGLAIDSGN